MPSAHRNEQLKVPNQLPKIDPSTWVLIVILIIIVIAAVTGAAEVRIELGPFKVMVASAPERA